MAFVVAQRLSTVLGWTKQYASRRAASWLRARHNLAPQEGANLYVSRMPSAVITTSVGGHPARSESNLPGDASGRDTLRVGAVHVPGRAPT
jgi:hypothetical protein